MLVLKILGVIALLASVLGGLHFFDEHCDEKFSHRFFTKTSFWATVGALALLVGGNWWRTSALHSGGDPLNGIVIIGIGVLVALGLIYLNFKRTNFAYGFGGTVLQLAVFGVLAYIGPFVLLIGLLLRLVSNIGVQHVRVIK